MNRLLTRCLIILLLCQPMLVFAGSGGAAGNNLQIGLSGLTALGGSSANNDELATLQAGGHDPNQNGFTIQNLELSLGAAVDPYFDAQANIVL